jgi:SAM-dependent methyltransferase
LEVGCGNGINCVALAQQFPEIRFDGIDLIPEMIVGAIENGNANKVGQQVRFFEGDVLKVDSISDLQDAYDIVFTVRCLINLNSVAQQNQAITTLSTKVRPGGYLIMIENSTTTYGSQNQCRELLGLDPRTPATFNLFFDEIEIRRHIAGIGLEMVDVEDFSSLHDLMLYAVLPSLNDGKIDYEHPVVKAAAELSARMAADKPGQFGAFGQNRLFVCQRKEA